MKTTRKSILAAGAVLMILFGSSACVLVQKDNSREQFNTLLLLYLLVENAKSETSTTNPTVTMTNNSGGPESYFMYTDSSCTGTATYEFSNPVSTGNTTSAMTISAGAYYISIFGVVCTSSAISFENGVGYACASDGTSISCSGTPI